MTNLPEVKIKKLQAEAKLPAYAHESDAGMDLYASETTILQPGEWKAVSTGIAIELPQGIEAQVRPKSGLALNHGLGIVNSPGTIDPDYRGEIKVILINFGKQAYTVEKWKKIAQVVFNKIEKPIIKIVEELSGTKRGPGGFGSTGLH